MPSYLTRARQAQRFTLDHLGHFVGGPDCARATFLSYRRSDAEPQWADLWYVATQLGADAALLAVDPDFGSCTIERAAAFIDRFYDRASRGYLARGDPDGHQFLRPDCYSDDHGHLGLMLLDAYAATGHAAFLARARRAADFLISSGIWDGTFGGGFWWNSRRGDSLEGKPAQTNGLAAHLFARLYALTGERLYRDWASRTLTWLDGRLYDPSVGLYRWSIHFRDLARRTGEVVANRFFNYDQGIIIEALLGSYQDDAPLPAHLSRAQALAGRLEDTFWQRQVGGFNLEAGVEQVMAIYSAWLTPSLLSLFAVDRDERWLALARQNVDALNDSLLAPDGGYYLSRRLEQDAWVVNRTRDTAANAGLQWAQARLAAVG